MALGEHTEANKVSGSKTGLLFVDGETRQHLDTRPENLEALSFIEDKNIEQIQLSSAQRDYLESFGGSELLDPNNIAPITFMKCALFALNSPTKLNDRNLIGRIIMFYKEDDKYSIDPHERQELMGFITGRLLGSTQAFVEGKEYINLKITADEDFYSIESFTDEIQELILIMALAKVFQDNAKELGPGQLYANMVTVSRLKEENFPDSFQDEIILAKKEAAQQIRDMIRHFQLAHIDKVKSAEYDSIEDREEAIEVAERKRRQDGMTLIPVLAKFLDEPIEAIRDSLMGPLPNELVTSKAEYAKRAADAIANTEELQAQLEQALAQITKLKTQLEASNAQTQALANTANAHLDTLEGNFRKGGIMSKPSILHTPEVAQGIADLRAVANN